MRDGKPVKVRRGAFGTWFATRGEKEAANGLLTADTRFMIENADELEEYIREREKVAWAAGFKQGGPMHDVNYDDPDAHTRNPYDTKEEA
jgi:hypothetical protein